MTRMQTHYLFRAVVFDMDGTLVDSVGIKTWAFGKLYEKYGQDVVDAVVSYHLKHQGISRFEKFRHWQTEILAEPYTKAVGELLSQQFNHLVLDAIVRAPYIRGAQEFLEKYYERLPLFVASATPEAELHEIVFRRGMKKYFQGVYGSPASKGEIINRISTYNRWKPTEVLMVGDAASDCEGANNAGASFVAICEGEIPAFFDNVTRRLADLTGLENIVYEPS